MDNRSFTEKDILDPVVTMGAQEVLLRCETKLWRLKRKLWLLSEEISRKEARAMNKVPYNHVLCGVGQLWACVAELHVDADKLCRRYGHGGDPLGPEQLQCLEDLLFRKRKLVAEYQEYRDRSGMLQ